MSRIDDFLEMLDGYEGREPEPVIPVFYNGLEWQIKAYREPGEDDKALLMVFADSQEELVKAGYERHPLSAEAYDLIIAHLEGKLTPELDKIVEDMLTGSGEFFCQAIETARVSNRNIATIYEHVTVLPRNTATDGYEKAGMKYSGAIKKFDVSDLEFVGDIYYFKDIYGRHDDLIEYLTSRKFDMLPDKIKEKGGIGLLSPGIWPIGRGVFVDEFNVSCFYGTGASRGVRPAKVKIK